eukprot:scaffold44895_cov18-Prasinocladus_malaysianus.AAC.2
MPVPLDRCLLPARQTFIRSRETLSVPSLALVLPASMIGKCTYYASRRCYVQPALIKRRHPTFQGRCNVSVFFWLDSIDAKASDILLWHNPLLIALGASDIGAVSHPGGTKVILASRIARAAILSASSSCTLTPSIHVVGLHNA